LYRDQRGYRLVPKRPLPPLRPGQSSLDRILSAKAADITDRVVGNGGALVPYKPLSKLPELFKVFAKIPRTAEGVLNFINTYGHFTNAGLAHRTGDMVPAVLDEAEEISKRLNRLSLNSRLGADIRITTLHASLVTDRVTGGVELKLTPATLRDALWLQLAQAITEGAKIRKCLHCNEWFRAGPGADRRADAEFCSDEHRKRFNSLQRSR